MTDNSMEIHSEELKETGLAPYDFELIYGICSPKTAIEKGFHPADQFRIEQYKRHDGQEFHYEVIK